MKRNHLQVRAVGALAALVIVVAVPASPAYADDTYFANGQSNPNLSINPYSYNSTWQTGIDKGIANWNATTSPVRISKVANSGSTVTAASYADSWFGLYQSCSSAGCVYISLNSRTISASASSPSNFIASVTSHEFGHAFKLGHRDGQNSIMNRDRPRNSMVAPSLSDITNVRNFYPGWPNQ